MNSLVGVVEMVVVVVMRVVVVMGVDEWLILKVQKGRRVTYALELLEVGV